MTRKKPSNTTRPDAVFARIVAGAEDQQGAGQVAGKVTEQVERLLAALFGENLLFGAQSAGAVAPGSLRMARSGRPCGGRNERECEGYARAHS
jgi:hypothetical protein